MTLMNILAHASTLRPKRRGINPVEIQQPLPVEYKQIRLDCGYRIDVFVDDRLIIELKSVDQLLKIHEAQVLTYMKLAKVRVGLLINFNVEILKKGIKRFVL